MKHLLNKAMALESEILDENIRRKEIKESKEYLHIADLMGKLTIKQTELLSVVPDSTPDLNLIKQDIMEHFKKKRIEQYDNCFGKFKEKKSVNSAKVLEVMGGDIDIFATISNISQKDLKAYAKDNKDIKKAIMGCVQVDSRELVDITIKY